MTATRLTAILLSLVATEAAVMAIGYSLWREGAPAAGLFPFMAAALLLATGIGSAITRAESGGTEPINAGRFLRYGAVIALYPLLITIIGTLAATAAVFFVILRGIERQSWTTAIACSVAAAAGSWILFGYLLGVPLPSGLLE